MDVEPSDAPADAHGAETPAAAPDEAALRGPVVEIDDARAMRALAHPARLAVVDRLYAGQVLTATECAAQVGLSPSAMSYHLRALERWGLVERSEAAGDGRERPWRATGRTLRLRGQGASADAAAAAVSAVLIERVQNWLAAERAARSADPARPHAVIEFEASLETLTQDEARDLAARVSAVVDDVVARSRATGGARADAASSADARAGARPYQVVLILVPEPEQGPLVGPVGADPGLTAR